MLSEFQRGAGDKVFVEVGRDAFSASGDFQIERPIGGESERVMPGSGDHPGFEGVKAIGAEV